MPNTPEIALCPSSMKTEEAIALAIARRSKQGFGLPVLPWIQEPNGEENWSRDILNETLAVAGLEEELIGFDTDSLQYGFLAWCCPVVLTRLRAIRDASDHRLEELARFCIGKDPRLNGAEFHNATSGTTKNLPHILKSWAGCACNNFIDDAPMIENILGLVDTLNAPEFLMGCSSIEQLYGRVASASYDAGFITPEVIETFLLRTADILDLDTSNMGRHIDFEDIAGAQLSLFLAVIAARNGIEFPETSLDTARHAKLVSTLDGRANAIDSGGSKGGELVFKNTPESEILSSTAIVVMAHALAGSVKRSGTFQGVIDACNLINPPEETLSSAELDLIDKSVSSFVSSGTQSEGAVRETLSEFLTPYFFHRLHENIKPLNVDPGQVQKLEDILTSALRQRFPKSPRITTEDYFNVISWRMGNLQ